MYSCLACGGPYFEDKQYTTWESRNAVRLPEKYVGRYCVYVYVCVIALRVRERETDNLDERRQRANSSCEMPSFLHAREAHYHHFYDEIESRHC